ncbi:MAG: chromate transporter [Treponema sp.]|nr:chromate transporter [Treponema sp.]
MSFCKKDGFLRILLRIYLVFAKIGAFTFGGGLAMMPIMQRELVEKRKWITLDELIDYYAIGQSTPGIVAVNVSTFVGYKRLGVIGGIIGTLGVVTPSLIIIMLLATLISSINDFPLVQKALRGINVAVAAMLVSVVVKFAKKTIKNIWNALFMLLAFVLIYFFKVQSVWIILICLLVGCILAIFRKNKKISAGNKNCGSQTAATYPENQQ